MADTLGIFDAKARFSELVERAGGGEEITITKRGAALAKLVQAAPDAKRSPEEAEALLTEWDAYRDRMLARYGPTTRDEVRAWIDEGRR